MFGIIDLDDIEAWELEEFLDDILNAEFNLVRDADSDGSDVSLVGGIRCILYSLLNSWIVKRYSSPEQVISQLRGITCYMGSHSVTCHPTQVNMPRKPQPDRLVLDLPTPEGWKAELT